MAKLTGKFRHACLEWDGLIIDETCPEIMCCGCYQNEVDKSELKPIQDNYNEELNEYNEKTLGFLPDHAGEVK